jgi:hypothetical protein
VTTLIAVVSDVHAGSTVAVMPPEVPMDDGQTVVASPAQRWLWGHWNAFWERAARLRDAHNAHLIAGFNGDLTEGYHHGTTQVVSANPTAQAAIVDAVMAAPLSIGPDRMFGIRGTEAHVGKSAAYEERAFRGLSKDGRNVIMEPDTGNASHWSLTLDIQGKHINFEHHGRMGQRPWTKPNVTANYAAEIFYEYAARGERHPDLAVRSHLHRYVDTYDQHPVRVIQTPAWQLATAFTYRLATPALADIGGLLILVQDGEITVEKYLAKPTRGNVVAA